MFDSLRHRFAQQGLRRLAHASGRKRRVHTLDTANFIEIVFDATEDGVRKDVVDWSRELEKAGKQVKILGYYDLPKAPEASQPFDFYFKRELNWNLSSKSLKVAALLKGSPDLLVSINPRGLLAIEWVVLQSKAGMKVGMISTHPNDLDIQIDLPVGSGVKKFVSELRHYLEKIITR